MKDNLSPEEKLLNLIKGRRQPATIHSQPQPAPKTHPAIPEVKPNIEYSAKSLPDTYLTFRNIKRMMLLLIGISLVYLIIMLAYPWLGFKIIKSAKVPEEKRLAANTALETEKKNKPYEFYLEGVKGRRIFSGEFISQEPLTQSPADADLIKNISLVGIISGDNPQAIIEDKKIQKTYYLSRGQSMAGMQIEDIKEGLVILNYNGQKYELYL